jgi:hypothetical protein
MVAIHAYFSQSPLGEDMIIKARAVSESLLWSCSVSFTNLFREGMGDGYLKLWLSDSFVGTEIKLRSYCLIAVSY